jgi:hypothetical protein
VNLYPNPTAPLVPLYPKSPVGKTGRGNIPPAQQLHGARVLRAHHHRLAVVRRRSHQQPALRKKCTAKQRGETDAHEAQSSRLSGFCPVNAEGNEGCHITGHNSFTSLPPFDPSTSGSWRSWDTFAPPGPTPQLLPWTFTSMSSSLCVSHRVSGHGCLTCSMVTPRLTSTRGSSSSAAATGEGEAGHRCLPHCVSLTVSPSLCVSHRVSLTVSPSLCVSHRVSGHGCLTCSMVTPRLTSTRGSSSSAAATGGAVGSSPAAATCKTCH